MSSKRVFVAADDASRTRLIDTVTRAGLTAVPFHNHQALLVSAHMDAPDYALLQWSLVKGTPPLKEALPSKPTITLVLLDPQHLALRPSIVAAGAAAMPMGPLPPNEFLEQVRRVGGGAARIGRRLNATLPATVTAGTLKLRGMTADISPQGLGLVLERGLPLQTDVVVRLMGRQHSLELSGTVVSDRAQGERRRVGIRLPLLSSDDRTRLRELAQAHPVAASELRITPLADPAEPNAVSEEALDPLVALPDFPG